VLFPLGFKEAVFQVFDEKSTGMIGNLVRRLNQSKLSNWTKAVVIYQLKE